VRRVLLLGVAAAGGLLVVAWARGGGPVSTSPAAPASGGARLAPPVHPPPGRDAPSPGPMRNLFEYGQGDRAPEAPLGDVSRRGARPVIADPPTPEPVRWVGLVRRGGEVRVALSLLGEVVILAPGETFSGYTLLTVDEDAGARLRTPSGAEVTVSPEP